VAADSVGRKYLQRPLYDEMRSPTYRNILRYIAALTATTIRRADAVKALPEKEAKSFDNFVQKMRSLGLLRPLPGTRGEYVFTNSLFHTYVIMQDKALREKSSPSGK